MSRGFLVGLCLATTFVSVAVGQEICFSEVDGNIPVEMESVPLPASSFVLSTEIPGSSNGSYITYKGRTRIGSPNLNEVLEYKVFSPFGGDYVLNLRATRDRSGTTIANDGANDFYINMPLASTPTRSFIKMFVSFADTDREWRWTTRLEVRGVKFRALVRLTPGLNNILVTGRSRLFSVDRMAFVRTSSVRNDAEPEMRVDCATGLAVDVPVPTELSCEHLASRVVIDLFANEFGDLSCNFSSIRSPALIMCSNGLCSNASEEVCRRKLTNRLRRRFVNRSICS